MSDTLLQNSHGHRPTVAFDFAPGGDVIAMDLAAETGVLLVATSIGQLMLLSSSGEPIGMELGFENVDRLVFADCGQYAAVVRDESLLQFLNTRLKPLWSARITGSITSVAAAPFGSHLAVATDAARIHVVNADRTELCRVDSGRPVDFLAFLQEQSAFVAAAEFGNMYCFDVHGEEVWHEQMSHNAGDLSVSSDGSRILMAAFNHGVQMFDGRGKNLGAYRVDGIPCRVSVAANLSRFAVLTLEHRILWLNIDGNVLWGADLSGDPPLLIRTGPLGDRVYVATTGGRILHLQW